MRRPGLAVIFSFILFSSLLLAGARSTCQAALYINDADTTNDVWCTAPGNDANNGLTPATPKATPKNWGG